MSRNQLSLEQATNEILRQKQDYWRECWRQALADKARAETKASQLVAQVATLTRQVPAVEEVARCLANTEREGWGLPPGVESGGAHWQKSLEKARAVLALFAARPESTGDDANEAACTENSSTVGAVR